MDPKVDPTVRLHRPGSERPVPPDLFARTPATGQDPGNGRGPAPHDALPPPDPDLVPAGQVEHSALSLSAALLASPDLALYERGFGLHSKPFAMTPDPSFLFFGESYRDAIAALAYGVKAERGFMSLIGEVGVGKTTVVHFILEHWAPALRTVFINMPVDRPEDLLRMTLRELGVAEPPADRISMLYLLRDYLLEEKRARRPPPLLIIDEGQSLSAEVLEQVRLFFNFEDSRGKLLQVILVGQPELEQLLLREDLRQLRQRLAVRCALSHLNPAEVRGYIEHRLRVAGHLHPDAVFSIEALGVIARASSGYPRLINILADQCLMNAFGTEVSRVDARIAVEAVVDCGLATRSLTDQIRERRGTDRRYSDRRQGEDRRGNERRNRSDRRSTRG